MLQKKINIFGFKNAIKNPWKKEFSDIKLFLVDLFIWLLDLKIVIIPKNIKKSAPTIWKDKNML